MTTPSLPLSAALDLPDEEVALRALVRVGVFLTGAAAAVAALVAAARGLSWATTGDPGIGVPLALAIAVWAGIQSVGVLAIAAAFAPGRGGRTLTWLTSFASLALAAAAMLHAGGGASDAFLAVVGLVFAALSLAWLAALAPAGARAGAAGPGLPAFARAIAAVGAFALAGLAVAAIAPAGTVLRDVAASIALAPAVVAGLAIPVWWLVAAFRLFPRR